jgi:hypothetical protein
MRILQGRLSYGVVAACAAVLLMPGVADAYIGPGVGISAVGSFFALLGAIVFAIVGFIWYPIKRLLRAVRRKRDTAKAETLSA